MEFFLQLSSNKKPLEMKFPLVLGTQNLLRSPGLYKGNFITVEINTLSWQFLCPCRRLEVMARATEFCLVRQ